MWLLSRVACGCFRVLRVVLSHVARGCCRMFAVHGCATQVEARTLGENCEVSDPALARASHAMRHRMDAMAARLRCAALCIVTATCCMVDVAGACCMLLDACSGCVLRAACSYLPQIIASNIDDHNSFLLEATEIISILGLSDGPTPTLTTVTLLP